MGDKYARTEFERRFLLRGLPAGTNPQVGFTRITDYYLPGTDLRLRLMESPEGEIIARKLAKKFKPAGAGPYRTTITNLYLSAGEYTLLEALPADSLVKKRYPVHAHSRTYSIDAFEGSLEGLLLAEIEALDLDSLLAIPPPPGTIREVTADPFFLGGNLVRTESNELQAYLRQIR